MKNCKERTKRADFEGAISTATPLPETQHTVSRVSAVKVRSASRGHRTGGCRGRAGWPPDTPGTRRGAGHWHWSTGGTAPPPQSRPGGRRWRGPAGGRGRRSRGAADTPLLTRPHTARGSRGPPGCSRAHTDPGPEVKQRSFEYSQRFFKSEDGVRHTQSQLIYKSILRFRLILHERFISCLAWWKGSGRQSLEPLLVTTELLVVEVEGAQEESSRQLNTRGSVLGTLSSNVW